MKNCLVCGNEKTDGKNICKMCGMKFVKGVTHSGLKFCSAACMNFFAEISRKSPYMAKRQIVI